MLSVFHGFRRRSKLSEAELEDQRALEQVMTENDINIEYCTVLYCTVLSCPVVCILKQLLLRFDEFHSHFHTATHHTTQPHTTRHRFQVGDPSLLVARGRYKCGRCGQLKVKKSINMCFYFFFYLLFSSDGCFPSQ